MYRYSMSKQLIGKSSAVQKYCEENEIPFFKFDVSNSLVRSVGLVIEEFNALTAEAGKL